MAVPVKSRPKIKLAKAKPTYRGVTILRLIAKSRFTDAQIRRAIKNAIAKNPDAFSNS